ncbi:hypothetical protein RJ55_04022 [Drechmeria coniospora]|nr:hypothetical protein RJ55_04022 [Drechmeria coniospora]
MELLQRNLSWDNNHLESISKAGTKGPMAGDGLPPNWPPSAARYVKMDAVKSWSSDDASGVRPGRNIEDVEREAIDHLFTTRVSCHRPWSPLRDIRRYLLPHSQPTTRSHSKRVDLVEPITNRKRSSAQPATENMSDSKAGTVDSLKNSSAPLPNAQTWQRQAAAGSAIRYTDNGNGKPADGNISEQVPTIHNNSGKHRSAKLGSSISSRPSNADGATKLFDDLEKYRPIAENQPNGLASGRTEERLNHNDDLKKYRPIGWDEPDGVARFTPGEPSKAQGRLQRNEPDAVGKLTPEEETKYYEDLDKYEGFVATEFKRSPVASKADERGRKENTGKQYDDLDKYGPVRWHEPDGLQDLTPEELSRKYKDLDKYRQYDNDDPSSPRIQAAEDVSKQYEDLTGYDSFSNTGPMTERIHPELTSRTCDDVEKHPSAGRDKVETMKAQARSEGLATHFDGSGNYNSRRLGSLSRRYPIDSGEATKFYADLTSHMPVMTHAEPANSSDVSDACDAKNMGTFSTSTTSTLRHCSSRSSAFAGTGSDTIKHRTADEIRSEVLRKARHSSQQLKLQRDKAEHERSWDAASQDAQAAIRQWKSKKSHAPTGSYGRDVPEDRYTSWHTTTRPLKPSMYPSNGGAAESDEPAASGTHMGDVGASSMDESFPTESSMLQHALDRGAMRRVAYTEEDSYSKTPQGLQTSYADECAGRPTWPTFEKHHKARGAGGRKGAAVTEGELRVLYKVLAYDSSTQSVRIGETTSSVAAESSESPSEVLLRLSNPSKFLPYFSSLEEQGYEMTSGGGDVLVFRKTRAARRSSVNPIDMMGSPVTGNFASPTGFVNYDGPSGEEGSKPAPPFRQSQGGSKDEACGGERMAKRKTKRSVGRKLVMGAAWVTGIAYAVGTLSEYYSTSGLDGMGRKGH